VSTERPVLDSVTVLLLSYQHGDFIREAIESLLNQTALPGEIIISDDQSSDHTWEEIQAVVRDYDGPVRLVSQQTPHRRGAAGNRFHAWKASTRQLVIFAHGDDISLPNRVKQIHAAWHTHGVSSISSNASHLRDGTRTDQTVTTRRATGPILLQEICETPFMPHMLGATLAIDRAVCERFPESMPPGGIAPGPGDVVLPLRGALLGGHWYIDEPLIDWRRHANQATSRFFHLEAENTDGPREAIEAFFVFGLLQRIRDIQHYRSGPHDAAAAALAQRLTFRNWMKRLSLWSEVRQRLERAGWTQHWA